MFYAISLRQLKIEVKHLLNIYCAEQKYYASHLPASKIELNQVVISIACLKKLNWFACIFSQFHSGAVGIIKAIPGEQRFFYQQIDNRYRKYSVWCISHQYFQDTVGKLKKLGDIQLEFVVLPSPQGLIIPQPFQNMNLTFSPRGS